MACQETVHRAIDLPSAGPLHVQSGLAQEALDPDRRHEVGVTAVDARGQTLLRFDGTVELMQIQPNGPDCEPTCHVATVKVPASR